MTDDQFRELCNTYGFAPSRALREMLDKATAQADAQRHALLEALKILVLATKDDNEEVRDIAVSTARAVIKVVEENT